MMDQNKIWKSFGIKTDKQNPRALAVNTVLAGKYLVGPVLGEGGFGITYAGYDLNMETRIAIKEYFPVELVTRDTTRRNAGDSGAVYGGIVPSANGASVSDNLAFGGGPSASGVSSSGGGSDRVISLSGEKSKTYQQGLKKYVDEARNVSQFAGIPGIVSVKDFFYENNTAYIVMEYIEGISLKEYLKQKGGQLPEEEALAILRPILEALEKVHAAGIVHRDISPDNIMLTFAEEGKTGAGQSGASTIYGNISAVKLIDFGAARMTSKNDQKSLTIILKHGYAPEEQYRSHGEQGPWTDVYALCAVLYRMLTGKVPEPAMDRLFSDNLKRPEELGAKVSPAVSEAVMKGLAVKKEKRIQSVRKLMDTLYAGKKLKKRGKLSRPMLIATLAAAAGALTVVFVALGIMGTIRTEHDTNEMAETGAMADVVEERTDGQREQNDPGTGENKESMASEDTLLLEEETEDGDWEVMVTRTPQTSCAGGDGHAVFLKEDGTVTSCGSNAFGQRNLSEWNKIAAVAAGEKFTAGLRENGTVVVAGELNGKSDVERWENVTAISASKEHLLGLTADGKILANATYGGVETGEDTDFTEWENIRAISAAGGVMAALTEDGRVLTVGLRGWEPAEIFGWEDVTALACSQRIVYGMTETGTVKYAHMWSNQPYDGEQKGIEQLQDMVQICADNSGIYGVTSDGRPCVAGADWRIERTGKVCSGWDQLFCVARLSSSTDDMAGLKKDGTLVKGIANYGDSEPEDMTGLTRATILSGLGDNGVTLVGMTEDNSIFTYGNCLGTARDLSQAELVSHVEQLMYSEPDNVYFYGVAWLDGDGTLYITKEYNQPLVPVLEGGRQIAAVGYGLRYGICVLMEDGTVSMISAGEETLPEGIRDADGWSGIAQIAGCAGRNDTGIVLGLKEDGTVISAVSPEYEGVLEGDWTQIGSLYSGDYAIGAIRKDGTAQFLEDSPKYNFGQYNTSGWTDLTQLALGQFHTAGLRSDGTVYATGRNDNGQCDVEDWTDIVWIAAGDTCTVGVRADGTLAVAGEVGW